MLRNVLADWVARITERELDIPFLLLLPPMGFYDVHHVHGTMEFGRDFIAKKDIDGQSVQFSFQTKRGDLRQSSLRNDVFGQLREAALVPFVHPNFDASLPHQVVLVTTGDVVGAARSSFTVFRDTEAKKLGCRPFELWTGSNLVDYFDEYGIESLQWKESLDYEEASKFLSLYSQALRGDINIREIEAHSRYWATRLGGNGDRLLWAFVEGEIIARRCLDQHQIYEAIYVQLALARTLFSLSYEIENSLLTTTYHRLVADIYSHCDNYVSILDSRTEEEYGFIRSIGGVFPVLTYPVLCARSVEITCLAYFLAPDEKARSRFGLKILDLVTREPGTAHPVSEFYSVHIVLAALALIREGEFSAVRKLLEDTTIWICDRHETGLGIAQFEADEWTQTLILLGAPFEFCNLGKVRDCLTATVICDLAALLGDSKFYADVVNDFQACEIVFPYWQPADTQGACFIESTDVVGYPNIEFQSECGNFLEFAWGEHLLSEQSEFEFRQLFGDTSVVCLMLLLRDRFFIKLWPTLITYDPKCFA